VDNEPEGVDCAR